MDEKMIEHREEFLKTLKNLQGKNAKIRMLDSNNRLNCTVEAFEPNMKFIAVSNLQTPIGLKKSAVIRVNDLVELEFDLS